MDVSSPLAVTGLKFNKSLVGWLVGWWSTKIEDQARTSPPAEAWGSSRPLNAAKVQPPQT